MNRDDLQTILRIAVATAGITAALALHRMLPAWAADFSSTNFISRDPVIEEFGGTGTSTSFEMIQSGDQIAPGEATSSNFILRSGFLYFSGDFSPASQNWQWFNDETNETPVSALAGENIAPTDVTQDNTIKLRLTITETSGTATSNIKYRLQFSEYSNFSQEARFVAESGSCTALALWCYGNGVDADDDAITTRVLSDSNTNGRHNESGVTSSTFDHNGGSAVEMEFTVRHAGARANATYYFRPVIASSSEPVALGAGEAYPSLSVEGATLTFTISGLATGTATEGVTTDAGTAAAEVGFGTLSFDTETEAAQRLSVSTNATEGYQIFLFQRQGLLAQTGDEIDPITSTNASPSAWSSACISGTAGCYGYHTGDDVLAGGSVRFAPNDTYAQFSSSPAEITYNTSPVSSETTDVVYKTRVTRDQGPGTYQSQVVYIIVPTF